jgi:CrcB protein
VGNTVLSQLLAIGLGGAAGSLARYGLSTWVHGFAGRGFPWGTLTVNVLGCAAMGALFVLLTERFADTSVLRAGLLIGVLGGFTTFSSFSIETFNLIEQGEHAKALLNAAASLLLCVGATWIGVIIGRQF